MVSLKKISYGDIIGAARFIDGNGIPYSNESREWDVIINGKKYPPKYIIMLAGGLSSEETRTGKAQERLRELGFLIVVK